MVIVHPTNGTYLYVGLEFDIVSDIKACLNLVETTGFDFFLIPLAKPRQSSKNEDNGVISNILDFEPSVSSDLELSGNTWNSVVLGNLSCYKLSDGLDLPRLENYFHQQLSWAQHLSLRTSFVVVDGQLTEEQHIALANMVCNALYEFPRESICIRVCIDDQLKLSHSENDKQKDYMDSWNIWNLYRQCCHYHSNLSVALECKDIVHPSLSSSFFQRWLSEPVRYVILDTKVFLKNRQGYPVLSKAFQEWLQKFFPYSVDILIRGEALHPNGYSSYLQYLGYLYTKQPTVEESYRLEMPYFDYLQTPLQPLSDHLDSQTYEIFEKDPVKYCKYEEALIRCFKDRLSLQGRRVPLVVMVLGAGRGPLVNATIRASEQVGIIVRIYAIEKNPHAVWTLRSIHQREPSWKIVEIIAEDMRYWNAPEQADVIVSELLGSFGDNELSPECLDAAQRFLQPDGISIPSEYTSYLCPLSSPKLYQEIRSLSYHHRDGGNVSSSLEVPYVVRIHQGQYLAESQCCFRFEHRGNNSSFLSQKPYHHFRYRRLSFEVNGPIMLHGFAGFFEAQLYDTIYISTHPRTLSHGMLSWFPFMFPLCYPIYCGDKSCRITLHIWRKTIPGKRIWYEWMITEPVVTKLHNVHGRCYSMKCS
ncbi:protein arginine N-methyltransferase 5 isoform 1 [Galdieria sulphuraria]|uniref:Protein arginine N-methyltransferase n=1 Tax=Galdieria sulphuraria TaxID=130081 RepID=M2XZY1_GALSU|nr:protein arginine N-methyltransferase 5 isoform 1 [Galdieria sulphuraria]EME29144.1 protein arginine N-methyltransferase 5 isoform 1 [Galdieria sulphuraria]|eukprot:XP_005705664.1 protein arginine N-methyltransferase 5 isoform 1 [Galdieria sulphuraria]